MGKKSDPARKAAKIQREQLARLSAISLPELEELALEAPELVGLLETEQLDPSAMEDIQVDSNLKDAQRMALEELQERGQTGLTAEDRARLNQVKRETEADNQARQKQILQGMAERGQMDSGAQLIAQLQSASQSNVDAAQAGERLASEAAAARRQALQQAGGMAGQMAQQEFGQQAQVSQAKDAINQFNLRQRADTAQTNLGARQNIANQQTAIANQNQQYNKQLNQQRFTNEMAKVSGQGQVANNLAQAVASQRSGPSLGQVVGTIGGGVAGAFAGGPMGAMKGAQAGGAIGGIFKDGGIVKKYENGGPVLSAEEISQQLQNQFAGKTLQENLDQGNAKIYEQDTDYSAGQDMTYGDAKRTLDNEESGLGLNMETLGAAGDIAKGLQGSEGIDLKQSQTNYSAPKNMMAEMVKPTQFQNPFAMEDGGIANDEAFLRALEMMTQDEKDFISSGNGDIVDSGMESYADDRVDARLNDGEVVLNLPQQQRVMDMIKGKISPDDVPDEPIVEGVNKSYRDKMHEELDNPEKSEKQKKIEGLENLLKALGK